MSRGPRTPISPAISRSLELPNLVAALEFVQQSSPPERVVGLATGLEALIAPLSRSEALARVVQVRTRTSQQLGKWSHARFEADRAAVERLIDQGRHGDAVQSAASLLERAIAAGDKAYDGGAYDLAIAHITLGRALQMSGGAQQAVTYLEEAHRRFQRLGADRMADAALTDKADCLTDLGRYDEAAEAYADTAQRASDRGDTRSAAVIKGQLATLRMRQKRYKEALDGYSEAMDLFKQLGENGSVARAWHQIGMVHQEARDYEEAERAYQNALKLEAQIGDRAGDALTLSQLGNLYSRMDRAKDTVRFYRHAADVFAGVKDFKNEGAARSNVADELIKLKRYDEARAEILRAIECASRSAMPLSHGGPSTS